MEGITQSKRLGGTEAKLWTFYTLGIIMGWHSPPNTGKNCLWRNWRLNGGRGYIRAEKDNDVGQVSFLKHIHWQQKTSFKYIN
jgi:hypothetical protein